MVRAVSLLAEDSDLWDIVFQESAKRARFIERMVGRASAEILDVGCATGSLCALLRRRGLRTVGIDINEVFVDAARAKDPDGRYVVGDMRSFSLRKKFDVVICLGTTFAYNLTNNDVLATLGRFHHHLKVGGLLLIDVLNAIAFTGPQPFRRRTRHSFSVSGHPLTAKIEHRLQLKEQTMTEQLTWRGRKRGRPWVRRDPAESLRLFFPQELALFLETSSFSPILLTDRYTEPSQGFGGRRLIIAARSTAREPEVSSGATPARGARSAPRWR